jgi:sec-independent protein translocase protein TatA
MDMLVLLGGIGPTEIILVVVVLLLFFGGRKIPELMKGLGEGIREFKKASNSTDETPKEATKENEKNIENKEK